MTVRVLRVRFAAFLATAMVFALVPHEGCPQTDALLARMAKASGEPWRYHVHSTVVSTIAGHLVRDEIDEQGPLIVNAYCGGVVCTGIVSDAARARRWQVTYNGTPIPQSAGMTARALTLRAIASYAFTDPSFTASGGTVVRKSETTAAGNAVVPFAVTAPHGETLDALVDPQSALLVGVAYRRTILYAYEDQRSVGPLQLPFRIRGPDGEVERFQDRAVVDAPLHVPAGPKAAFVPGAAAARLEGGDVYRFPCRVQNAAARCLLDSGASGLAMSLRLADRLGAPLIGDIDLEGTGRVASGIVRASSLDLGSLRLGPALYAVLPDARGFGADVIVGADVLGLAAVTVDPVARTIRFSQPGAAPDGTVVPLHFDGLTPSAAIVLAGARYDLTLDTGDAASIDLSADFAAAHPGLYVGAERRSVIGVGGRGYQTLGTIARVEFGGYELRGVSAGTTEVPGSPAPARIGAGFLSRFRFTLDYPDARMSVRPVR